MIIDSRDRNLGATPGRNLISATDRTDAYRATLRRWGVDRDPEHPLRVRAGLRLQAALARRPIPRHRALVPITPED